MRLPDLSMWPPEHWTAVFQGVTAAIALVSVVFAFRQVLEARKLREEQAKPFVVVNFETSKVWEKGLLLVVENIGKTLARNVHLRFSPKLVSTMSEDGYDLNESILIQNGIPSMPPGMKVSALFDLSHKRKSADLPMAYKVEVEFEDFRGNRQTPLEYLLDLNIYYGLRSIREYGIHHAAKALMEIDRTLTRWTAHFNGLRVWVRDEDDWVGNDWMGNEAEQTRSQETAENEEG